MKVKLSEAHKAFLEEPFGIGTQLVKGMIEEYEEELEQVKAAILGFLEKLSYQHGNLTQKDGYYTMYENGKIWVYSPMCRMVRRFQHRLFQRNIYVPLDIQKCLHFEILLSIYNHTISKLYACHRMLGEDWSEGHCFYEIMTTQACKHLKDYIAPEECEQFPTKTTNVNENPKKKYYG